MNIYNIPAIEFYKSYREKIGELKTIQTYEYLKGSEIGEKADISRIMISGGIHLMMEKNMP